MNGPKNFIYGYIDPRNGHLRYVGKTSCGMKRPKNFIQHAGHCLNWVKNLAQDNLKPEIVILEELSVEASNADLNEAERHHIAYWKFLGCELTNHRLGGEGGAGYKMTLEHRANLSAALKGRTSPNKGKKLSQDIRAKISLSLTGKHHSQETRIRMSVSRSGAGNHMFGKTHTQETRSKISSNKTGKSNGQEGRFLTEEHKSKLSAAKIGERHPNFGKHLSEETKARISAAKKGGKHTEEAKAKMSATKMAKKSS
jgi:hypothetical protein